MRIGGWIWAGPAVFLLHDAEEVLTLAPWLREHGTELPPVVQPFMGVTTRQFALAVLLLFAGFLAAAAHGAWCAQRVRASPVFLLVVGVLIGNGLTHLAQAALFRGYTPGVVTALLVVLPYGYFLGERLRTSGLATRRTWAGAIAAGAVVQVPLAALMLLAVR
jgi:uncharacterized membrane protein YqaE (UPF0057 family)